MADRTLITVKPPIRVFDNGDGTWSIGIEDVNSDAILAGILALRDAATLDDIETAVEALRVDSTLDSVEVAIEALRVISTLDTVEAAVEALRVASTLDTVEVAIDAVLAEIVALRADAPLDPYLEIAQGNVSGKTAVNKFGRNIEIDSGVTADIWDGGHTLASGGVSLIWVAPTQARIHDIVSTSASDDGSPVGVGARTVRVYGLTDWDTAEVSEDITLNGTTNVPTVNAYVIIHRMEVLTKGATSCNVGVITATAQTDNTVTAQIQAGNGQTEMAIYGVPSTQKAYISGFYGEINKAGGAAGVVDTCLLENPEPDSELTNFLIKHRFGLQTVGTSAYSHPFNPYKKVEGPAIIKISVASGTNNMDVSAGFDLILVDN